jgi:hypothetical protein
VSSDARTRRQHKSYCAKEERLQDGFRRLRRALLVADLQAAGMIEREPAA